MVVLSRKGTARGVERATADRYLPHVVRAAARRDTSASWRFSSRGDYPPGIQKLACTPPGLNHRVRETWGQAGRLMVTPNCECIGRRLRRRPSVEITFLFDYLRCGNRSGCSVRNICRVGLDTKSGRCNQVRQPVRKTATYPKSSAEGVSAQEAWGHQVRTGPGGHSARIRPARRPLPTRSGRHAAYALSSCCGRSRDSDILDWEWARRAQKTHPR